MATTEQPSFALHQFRLATPGRLEVAGSWTGLRAAELEEPVLVLETGSGVERVPADRVRGSVRSWYAAFAWEGDLASLRAATLELSGDMVVDLTLDSSPRRRFGRVEHPAQPVEVRAREQEAAPEHAGDLVGLQAALVVAQADLADLQEDIKQARKDASRAQEDARRERARRESESTRHHQAVETLQRVAEEALQEQRGTVEAQAAELQRRGEALASAQDALRELPALRERLTAAEQERERGSTQLRAQLAALQEERDSARRELETSQAKQSQLNVLLSDLRAEAQRATQAEAARERSLVAARTAAKQAQQEAEQAREQGQEQRTELQRLQRIAGEADARAQQLHQQLGEASRAAQEAAAEVERLRHELADAGRIREAYARLQPQVAEVGQLREAYARLEAEVADTDRLREAYARLQDDVVEARRANLRADEEITALRGRLEAIRAALDV